MFHCMQEQDGNNQQYGVPRFIKNVVAISNKAGELLDTVRGRTQLKMFTVMGKNKWK